MKSTLAVVLAVVGAFFLASCSSPGVLQLSADTYVVSKSSAAGAFTNMAKLRASAIQEANKFAEERGKVAVAVSAREVVPTHGFPSYEYQFRLLEKDDARAQGVSLEQRADMVIERNDRIQADIRANDVTGQPSELYTALTELDDLRKRGILTDEEYEAEKRKLLDR